MGQTVVLPNLTVDSRLLREFSDEFRILTVIRTEGVQKHVAIGVKVVHDLHLFRFVSNQISDCPCLWFRESRGPSEDLAARVTAGAFKTVSKSPRIVSVEINASIFLATLIY